MPLYLVQGICQLQGLDPNGLVYWERQACLHRKLGERFHDIQTAVCDVMADTPRASSIVENLNSRLRNRFFLRRHIGNEYLDLLRFFFNHRRYPRSEREERKGKSPAELLHGQAHPHWLELLGFERSTSAPLIVRLTTDTRVSSCFDTTLSTVFVGMLEMGWSSATACSTRLFAWRPESFPAVCKTRSEHSFQQPAGTRMTLAASF